MKIKSPEKKTGQVYARVKKENEEWVKRAAKKAGFGRTSHFIDALFTQLREKELKMTPKHTAKPTKTVKKPVKKKRGVSNKVGTRSQRAA